MHSGKLPGKDMAKVVKLMKLCLCHLLPHETVSGKPECMCREVSVSIDFYFML